MDSLRKKEGGFSLVELMVVVSIITVLSTFAIPNYVSFKIRAAKLEAQNNIRHFQTVLEAYHAETGAYASAASGYVNTEYIGPRNFLGFAQYNGSIPFLGLSFADDIGRKLYYYYVFELRENGYAIGAYNFSFSVGGLNLDYGSKVPTKFCRTKLAAAGSSYSYFDMTTLEVNSAGLLGAFAVPSGNALVNCF